MAVNWWCELVRTVEKERGLQEQWRRAVISGRSRTGRMSQAENGQRQRQQKKQNHQLQQGQQQHEKDAISFFSKNALRKHTQCGSAESCRACTTEICFRMDDSAPAPYHTSYIHYVCSDITKKDIN